MILVIFNWKRKSDYKLFCAGEEAGVEARIEGLGEAGEDFGEALMGEIGVG